MIYKNFTITEDKMLGYSLFDSKGRWCQSATSEKELINSVDKILSVN